MQRNQAALEQYEERSSAALIALAFAFLGLYAAQVLWLSAPPTADLLLEFGQNLIWVIFLVDFTYRV